MEYVGAVWTKVHVKYAALVHHFATHFEKGVNHSDLNKILHLYGYNPRKREPVGRYHDYINNVII